MARKSFLLIAASLLAANALAQKSSGEIKVEVVNGHLFVQAKVNGIPVRLAVDSGAQMNALTPELAMRLDLKELQKVNAVGVGSKPVEAYIGKVDLLEVGAAGSVGESVVVIPLPKELKCDGLVGYGFLSHFVTTIDYDRQTIRFDRPEEFKPDTEARVLPIRFKSGIPEVEGSVEGVSGWLSLDTGANGNLSIFGPFADQNKLREKFPKRVLTVTGAGVGGAAMGEVVRMNSVTLGDIKFPPLIVNLSKQTSGVFASTDRMGNISSDILSRFVVTLDYPGKKIYLKKGPGFDRPSEWNRSGLFVSFEDGTPRVVWVIKDTPASEAGILLGDQVVEFNGRAVDTSRASEFKSALRGAIGSKLKLKLRRANGSIFDAELVLREIID